MAFSSNVRSWATAISTNEQNGRRIVFRYVEELSASFDQACQPVRVIVVWKYQSENGQPTSADHKRMNELEDMLESVLNEDGFATLSLVSTGEDLREWTYYTKSEAEFMARLNYALAGMSAFPIEIHVASDPHWDVYERFRAGVKKS
jgi:hypothetical protein